MKDNKTIKTNLNHINNYISLLKGEIHTEYAKKMLYEIQVNLNNIAEELKEGE